MPNEGSYGGYISVRRNGSVVWQIEPREFPKDRDTDGTLEYAIRVVSRGRKQFSSRDGKCLISVDADASDLNKEGEGADNAKFLIVSGYDTPDTPYDSLLVGKSYFVTYDRYVPLEIAPWAENEGKQSSSTMKPSICYELPWDRSPDDPNQIPFVYDLSIRYDDYDLERAGLPADLDLDKLEIYYQNFVSLRDIYRYYYCKDALLAQNIRQRFEANEEGKEQVIQDYEMTPESLQIALIWSKTYRHLEKLGINRGLLDDIGSLMRAGSNYVEEQGDEKQRQVEANLAPDVVFSRWMPVIALNADNCEQAAKTTLSRLSSDPIEITAKDLAAVPGKPLIKVHVQKVLGSRTITLQGVNLPSTFVLMYRGDLVHYDRNKHAG